MSETLTTQEIELIQRAVQNPLASMRSLVKNSLYLFLQYFWTDYTTKKFKANWHIGIICKELEQLARRVAAQEPKKYDILLINVPPGTTKTATISVMFPLWCWVNWHWMRFITGSYTSPLALESAEYSRDIMRSDRFKQMFPELDIKEDKDNKSNYKIIKRDLKTRKVSPGGNRLSTSIGGSVTGFHGDINIMDDPLDPERSHSDVELKKANRYMDSTFPYRVTEQSISPTVLVMQRLHQADPTGHLLENESLKIRYICLPGEITNFEDKVKPQEYVKYYKDDLLDPVRLGWDSLKKLESRGQHYYSGQVGQNPVPPGGAMFKVDHFQEIEKINNRDANVVQSVRYWDKAGSEGTGAYTVGVRITELQNGKYVVEDVKRGQWSSETREDIIKQTAEADGKDVVVGVEQEPGSGGKDSAGSTVKNLAGYSVVIDLPSGDKINRADPFSTQVNWGNVHLVRADWNATYKNELEFFPNSTYKDQVDASSGAFKLLTEYDGGLTW